MINLCAYLSFPLPTASQYWLTEIRFRLPAFKTVNYHHRLIGWTNLHSLPSSTQSFHTAKKSSEKCHKKQFKRKFFNRCHKHKHNCIVIMWVRRLDAFTFIRTTTLFYYHQYVRRFSECSSSISDLIVGRQDSRWLNCKLDPETSSLLASFIQRLYRGKHKLSSFPHRGNMGFRVSQ